MQIKTSMRYLPPRMAVIKTQTKPNISEDVEKLGMSRICISIETESRFVVAYSWEAGEGMVVSGFLFGMLRMF